MSLATGSTRSGVISTRQRFALAATAGRVASLPLCTFPHRLVQESREAGSLAIPQAGGPRFNVGDDPIQSQLLRIGEPGSDQRTLISPAPLFGNRKCVSKNNSVPADERSRHGRYLPVSFDGECTKSLRAMMLSPKCPDFRINRTVELDEGQKTVRIVSR